MRGLLLLAMILIVVGSLFYLIGYFNDGISGNVVFGSDSDKFVEGFVGKVIDGDTVIVNGESVRLLGIDTDEKGYDCFNEAKVRMEKLVLNKDVRMEKDKRDKDQYERYLRYIFVMEDDREVNVNLVMVEEGLAIARFYEDRKYKDEILESEKRARGGKKGCKWEKL
jgi:endonuclease YncB( thermonuclease family)